MSKVAVNCPKCKEVLLLEDKEVMCKCGHGPFSVERRTVGFRVVMPK